MEEVREMIGGDTPTYISFDIDALDPAFAPGTGLYPFSCHFLKQRTL